MITGLFDRNSGCVVFNYSFKEFLDVNSKKRQEMDFTNKHERIHLYQRNSSTFGYYIQCINNVQVAILIDLLLELKNNNEDYLPLSNAQSSKSVKIRNIDLAYRIAEYVKRFFIGTVDDWLIYSEKNRDTVCPIMSSIRKLNFYLEKLFLSKGVLEKSFEKPPGFYEGDDLDISQDAYLMGLKISGHSGIDGLFPSSTWDVDALAEIQAIISEYWGTNISLNTFTKEVIEARLLRYHVFETCRDTSWAQNTQTLIQTWLSICDLAFNPPILPNLLNKQLTILELHPLQRFINATAQLKSIKPVISIEEDYSRFISEICSNLNWIPLKTIIDSNCEEYVSNYSDYYFYLFHNSQLIKKNILPSLFVSSVIPDFKPEFKSYLNSTYTFPIIYFTDKVMFHKNKDIVLYITTNELLQDALFQLYESPYLHLKLPYHAEEVEYDYYKSYIDSFFESNFGIRAPIISFYNGRKINK